MLAECQHRGNALARTSSLQYAFVGNCGNAASGTLGVIYTIAQLTQAWWSAPELIKQQLHKTDSTQCPHRPTMRRRTTAAQQQPMRISSRPPAEKLLASGGSDI